MVTSHIPPCPLDGCDAVQGWWKFIHQLQPEIPHGIVDPRRFCAPEGPPDVRGYFLQASRQALLRKCPSVQGANPDARRDAAFAKWLDGERSCYQTNLRIRALRSTPDNLRSDADDAIAQFGATVRKLIKGWLGKLPDVFEHDHSAGVDRHGITPRHGPGATYSDRGRLTTWADKFSSVPSVTRDAYVPSMFLSLGTMWGAMIASRGVDLVPGNRFATVPKTSKIDRCIASEPTLNVWGQLGVGGALRRALKHRAGWDLDHAQDIHREIARESSVSQSFATIDLSNASDTVCSELVAWLLPSDWYDLMVQLRSPKTFVPHKGAWFVLEKFSSMGNGYTFELETVIFSALACAWSRHCGFTGRLGVDVFVFGDDIILPDCIAAPFLKVLSWFGFSTNVEKTFIGDVPFRESCGADYLSGYDVRPIFIDDVPDQPSELVVFANKANLWLSRLKAITGYAPRRGWFELLECLPKEIRELRGPTWLGDQVIHDEHPTRWKTRVVKRRLRFSELVPCTPTLIRGRMVTDRLVYKPDRSPVEVMQIRVLRRIPRRVSWKHWKPEVVLACAVLGYGDGRLGVIPRDSPFVVSTVWTELPGDSSACSLTETAGRWGR